VHPREVQLDHLRIEVVPIYSDRSGSLYSVVQNESSFAADRLVVHDLVRRSVFFVDVGSDDVGQKLVGLEFDSVSAGLIDIHNGRLRSNVDVPRNELVHVAQSGDVMNRRKRQDKLSFDHSQIIDDVSRAIDVL